MLASHVSNHPEIMDSFRDAAVKICSLDSIVYESVRSTINDPDAVALLDSVRQGQSIPSKEIVELYDHPEKAVRNLAKDMVCKLV